MNASTLDDIFRMLYPQSSGEIFIGSNPGETGCNDTLVPAGWTVLQYYY